VTRVSLPSPRGTLRSLLTGYLIGERLSAAHVPHSCAELSAVKKHYLPRDDALAQ
jgi:hypothetical protein